MSASPPRISLIAAMDRNRLIGVHGERMPWHLPEDLRHFKRTTMGKPVIMGRKTFASIGHALPGRLNIVITRGNSIAPIPGQLATSNDLAGATQLASDWLDKRDQLAAEHGALDHELFVIGGAMVYAQAIGFAERMYLTEIDADFVGDNYFPSFLDMTPGWAQVSSERHHAGDPNNFEFAFVIYERRAFK